MCNRPPPAARPDPLGVTSRSDPTLAVASKPSDCSLVEVHAPLVSHSVHRRAAACHIDALTTFRSSCTLALPNWSYQMIAIQHTSPAPSEQDLNHSAEFAREHSEVNRIIGELVAFIRKRGFDPGERIGSERDFASRFGAGRGVIREALSALESMRVVERRPNSGIYLRPIEVEGSIDAMVLFNDLGIPATHSEVLQLVEMRRMLEIQSVAMAAVRWQIEDMNSLDAILLATEVKLARGESIVDQDSAFHLQVIACAKNQFIQRVVHSYYLASRARRHRYFHATEQCAASHLGHVVLRDAIHARDTDKAIQAMEVHLEGMESYWLERVEDKHIV